MHKKYVFMHFELRWCQPINWGLGLKCQCDYHLMHVKSIVECSNGRILQYFRPSLSYHLPLRPLFCLFLSGRLKQVLNILIFGWTFHYWCSLHFIQKLQLSTFLQRVFYLFVFVFIPYRILVTKVTKLFLAEELMPLRLDEIGKSFFTNDLQCWSKR